MKLKLTLFLIIISGFVFAQDGGNYWTRTTATEAARGTTVLSRKEPLPDNTIFKLDLNGLKNVLAKSSLTTAIPISIPNAEGNIEQYLVNEEDILSAELVAQNTGFKVYSGICSTDSSKRIFISTYPGGVYAEVLKDTRVFTKIDSYTKEQGMYVVYKTPQTNKNLNKFECFNPQSKTDRQNKINYSNRADDGTTVYKEFRLAVTATTMFVYSCREFNASSSSDAKISQDSAYAKIILMIVQVNDLFERDTGIKFKIINKAKSTKPYFLFPDKDFIEININDSFSDYNIGSMQEYPLKDIYWGIQNQKLLTTNLGNSEYDVGMLFSDSPPLFSSGGYSNGRACNDSPENSSLLTKSKIDFKGINWTSKNFSDNENDFYLILAHEIGHTVGANHTFSYDHYESESAQVEPGSGSTIMAYPGKGKAENHNVVQSIDANTAYFHAKSIEQIKDFVKQLQCGTIYTNSTALTTSIVYSYKTIPINTPFVLEGVKDVTDTNSIFTYTWEQMDARKETYNIDQMFLRYNEFGGIFKSLLPTTYGNIRFLPKLDNNVIWNNDWESLPAEARSLNFRYTVRNNDVITPKTISKDIEISVVKTNSAFKLKNPEITKITSGVSSKVEIPWSTGFVKGSLVTLKWDVAETRTIDAKGINCDFVDIFLSNDGGLIYTTNIAINVPNDGSYVWDIPSSSSITPTYRIMIKASDNIFFNISDQFKLLDDTKPLKPTLLVVGEIKDTSVTLNFDNLYDKVGVSSVELYINGSMRTFINSDPERLYQDIHNFERTIQGLNKRTGYEMYIIAINEAGNKSERSDTQTYDDDYRYPVSYGLDSSQNTISRLTVETDNTTENNSINFSPEPLDPSSGGVNYQYQDFTTTGNSSTMKLSKSSEFKGKIYVPATTDTQICYIWIDYNKDGKFEEDPIIPTKESDNFVFESTVPDSAIIGDTRMRISYKTSSTEENLELFSDEKGFAYGVVQDYKITIDEKDTIKPETPNLAVISNTDNSIVSQFNNLRDNVGVKSGTDYSVTLQLNNLKDNVGVKKINIYKNGLLLETIDYVATSPETFSQTKIITGLNKDTSYEFYIITVDQAGNESDKSNVLTVGKYPISYSLNSSISKINKLLVKDNKNSEDNLIDYSPSALNPNSSTADIINRQYQDFTATGNSSALGKKSTMNLYKSCKFSGEISVSSPTFFQSCKLWIDYNQDGIFSIDESIMINKVSDKFTFNNTIPNTATTGPTRMRISYKTSATEEIAVHSSDEKGFDNGIVQDYTVTISPDNENPVVVSLYYNEIRGASRTPKSDLVNVKLTWNKPLENYKVKYYHIYKKLGKADSSDSFTEIKSVDVSPINGIDQDTDSKRTYTFDNLDQYEYYTFKVTAENASGNLSDDSILTIQTKDTQAPSDPTIINGIVKTAYTACAAWSSLDPTPGSGIKDYTAEVSKDNSLIYNETSSFSSIAIGGLEPDTEYKLKVNVKDRVDNSSWMYKTFRTDKVEKEDEKEENKEQNTNESGTSPTSPAGVAAIASLGAGIAGIFAGAAVIVTIATVSSIKDKDGKTIADTDKPNKPANLTFYFTPISYLNTNPSNDTEVNLIWIAPNYENDPTLSKFLIYMDGKLNCYSGKNYTTIKGLKAKSTHIFKVQALDSSGNHSELSEPITVTMPDITPPTQPTNLEYSGTNGTNSKLTWTASTDNVEVTGYDVYQNGKKINPVLVIQPEYQLKNLVSFTDYNFYVKAIDAATNISGSSNIVNITAPDVVPPTMPENLLATAIRGLKVNLSWSASTDNSIEPLTYLVYKLPLISSSTLPIGSGLTATNFLVSGLQDSEFYRFGVVAVDAAGNKSTFSIVEIKIDETPPTAPSTLMAINLNESAAKLFWNQSTDIVDFSIKYNIYKKISGSYDDFEFVEKTVGTNFGNTDIISYTVNGLDCLKTYQFKVNAEDKSNNVSGFSETAETYTKDKVPPTVVTNLTGIFEDNKIKLQWNPATDSCSAVKYEICFGIGNEDFVNTPRLIRTTNTSYEILDPVLGVNYRFRIRSIDSSNNQNDYGETLTIIPIGSPLSPSVLKIDTFAINSLNVTDPFLGIPLSWTASQSPGVSYRLFFKSRLRSATYQSIEIPAGNNSFLLPVSLCPLPMDYDLYLVSVRNNLTSSPSNIIYFKNPPTRFDDYNKTTIGTETYEFDWYEKDKSEKIKYYEIYRKDPDNKYYFLSKIIVSNSRSPYLKRFNYQVNGLDINSSYSIIIVATDMFGNSSETVNNINAFSILNSNYCPPFLGAIAWDKTTNKVSEGSFISNVLIDDEVLQESNENYSQVLWSDYNDFVTNVSKSSSSNILKVKVNAKDQNLNGAMVAYIDYNKNKVFEPTEKITFGSLSNKAMSINVPLTFISDPFIIPNKAIGKTKMRIVYQRNNNSLDIDPCSFDGIGEVEDYIINFEGNNNKLTLTKESLEAILRTIILYPNPVNGEILNISGVENNLPYKIINMLGQVIATGKIENGTINIARLPNNAYSLEIFIDEVRTVKRFIKQ